MKAKFPKDEKLLANAGKYNAYSPKVQGVLTATRCLGNTWLKLPSIGVHKYLAENNYKQPFEKLPKPYVDHSPDI